MIKFMKEHKQFTVFLFFAVIIVLIAVFAPLLAPKDPYEDVYKRQP